MAAKKRKKKRSAAQKAATKRMRAGLARLNRRRKHQRTVRLDTYTTLAEKAGLSVKDYKDLESQGYFD